MTLLLMGKNINRISLLYAIISVFIFIITGTVSAQNPTEAGYIVTNTAVVMGNNFSPTSAIFLSPSVTAYYGISEWTIPGDQYVIAGNSVTLNYAVTNMGNISDRFYIIVSNFEMVGGYAGSDWTVSLIDHDSGTTLGTFSGTGGPFIFSTNLTRYTTGLSSFFEFDIQIDTAGDSSPADWGYVAITITNESTSNTVQYTGDNGLVYGGVDVRTTSGFTPIVNIAGPDIGLVKYVFNVSSTPIIPGTDITYSIVYDNDGNSAATNLVIIDTIPDNTAFIIGSVNPDYSTDATYVLEYSDDGGLSWGYTPTGTPGDIDANITHIRIRTIDGIITSDSTGSGDTVGPVDSPIPDDDAGGFTFDVRVLEN